MKLKNITTAAFSLMILIMLQAGAVRSQAWMFGKNKVQYDQFEWNILHTPHFDIHFSEGYRDLAARTGVMLEDGYRDVSGSLGHRIKWRIPVILYGSHSAFQQTNTTWSFIQEGVQAFAEPNRRRMVLHFSGDNTDYRNTAVHELIHIFEFDIIYGNLLRSVFSRSLLFRIPLWLAEGCSEYYSKGFDDEADMFMRDATIFDYAPRNLDYAGGYMVYKAGQSVIDYIVKTYGERKVIDIMRRLRETRSIDRALRETIGLNTAQLTEEWRKYLRRRYWPMYADKNAPEKSGRRLTDHMEEHHYSNSKPEFASGGEEIVFYSRRGGLDGIYLMNAVTGEVEKQLIEGNISDKFEILRSMKSNLAVNPAGDELAFVAKSSGANRMFILDIPSDEIIEEIELPLDFFFSPSYSPDGSRIAFSGVKNGQTDIYILERASIELRKVTDDVQDEKDVSWYPGGERLIYSRSPRLVQNPDAGIEERIGIDYFAREIERGSCSGDIWMVDLQTGSKEVVISTGSDDLSPLIIKGGKEIVFISNESGIFNLYRGSVEYGNYYRFTDVIGGLFSPDYSSDKDRLVYTAFNSAGYDIFIMDNFSEDSDLSYPSGRASSETGGDRAPAEEKLRSIAMGPENNGKQVRSDSLEAAPASPDDIAGQKDINGTGTSKENRSGEVVINEDSEENVNPDTVSARRERMKEKVGTVQAYKTKFSPDYVSNGMGVFYSTGYGFGFMNSIAFSDLLGDHRIHLSFNIHRSIEDSDILLSYYYLKRRIDYSFGIFHLKNYINSRVTSLGETFLDYRLFTERNYGVFSKISYPFSTFTRVELEAQGYVLEREFFDNVGSYWYAPTGEKLSRRIIQPTLSLVHDSAYYGNFGPVIGSRWMLSYSRSINLSSDDINRSVAFYDYRKYMPVFYRNYLAFRAVGSVSSGRDSRYFFLGGPVTMRGYDYLAFQGTRMMLFNLEYRYPLVDALIFGWPGRWGIYNIGGTLFFDTGSVWGDDIYLEDIPGSIDPVEINDLKFYSDFGVGFYMRMGFLIFNFQLAWPTDFEDTAKPEFHFYLGPQF
ncbi:MAG: hypothetical protein GF417_01745 [Candidatus Latescibacteria bacterium]|nr:hypothetical protein [bacterium]MBD3423150.1 hypothetical protein [Candidatus Latescibacterota bacterium]